MIDSKAYEDAQQVERDYRPRRRKRTDQIGRDRAPRPE
jgi:hypothetical protein